MMPKPSKKDCAKYCENYATCQSKNWQCKRAVVFSGRKSWMGTVAEVRRVNFQTKGIINNLQDLIYRMELDG